MTTRIIIGTLIMLILRILLIRTLRAVAIAEAETQEPTP